MKNGSRLVEPETPKVASIYTLVENAALKQVGNYFPK